VSALGLQLSLKVGDQKQGVFGPQLLVPKVETQKLFAIHLLLEKKICPDRRCLKTLIQNQKIKWCRKKTFFM
jgi:hypothetical protein